MRIAMRTARTQQARSLGFSTLRLWQKNCTSGGMRSRNAARGLRLFVLASTLALMCAASSQASSITWNLNDVTLQDQASVTGWLSVDSVTGLLTSWNIDVSAGTLGNTGITVNPFSTAPAWSSASILNDGDIQIEWTRSPDYILFFSPLGSLLSAGSTVALGQGTEALVPNGTGGWIPFVMTSSGSLTSSSPVPEPATWALLATGGLLLAGWAWRRRGVTGYTGL